MRIIDGLILIKVLLFCFHLLASPATNTVKRYNHSLIMSGKYYNLDYKEDLPAGYKSTENGWLYGVSFAYVYSGVSFPLFGRTLLEYTDDKTKYDGTTQTGIPVTDKTRNNFLTLEANIGWTLNIISSFSLALYTGVGYRYWYRGGSESEYLSPYSEEYSWIYYPVGIRPLYKISKRIRISMDLSMKIMSQGKIRVNFGEFDPGFNNPEGNLGNKLGWKIDTTFHYQVYPRLFLLLKPWYEYSAIGKSNMFDFYYYGIPYIRGYEPSSCTYQYGVDMGINLEF